MEGSLPPETERSPPTFTLLFVTEAGAGPSGFRLAKVEDDLAAAIKEPVDFADDRFFRDLLRNMLPVVVATLLANPIILPFALFAAAPTAVVLLDAAAGMRSPERRALRRRGCSVPLESWIVFPEALRGTIRAAELAEPIRCRFSAATPSADCAASLFPSTAPLMDLIDLLLAILFIE